MTRILGKFCTDISTALEVGANERFTFETAKADTGNLRLSADNQAIQILVPGIYRVSVNVNLVGTAAGVVTVRLTANGNPVSGAGGSQSIGAEGDNASIAFSTLLTVAPAGNGNTAELALLNAGSATGVTIANVIMERVD